jgi:hypothetical protein
MSDANGNNSSRAEVPVGANRLGVNVFTAPGKAMVGERPKPFGRGSASTRSRPR